MKDYCVFSKVAQHCWPLNALMNSRLFAEYLLLTNHLRLTNHSKHLLHILPVSRDISPAPVLMLLPINLMLWRQLLLMLFVRMSACAFQWVHCWFALPSVRVIKPQWEAEHLIDSFTLFSVENNSSWVHSDIGKDSKQTNKLGLFSGWSEGRHAAVALHLLNGWKK